MTGNSPRASEGLSSLMVSLPELFQLVRFFRRWWLLMAAMTVLSTLLTIVWVCAKGVEYQVSAALYYRLGPELAPPPTIGPASVMVSRRTEDVNDEIEILTSPQLLHQVVQDLGEDFFRAPPPVTRLAKIKRAVKDQLDVVLRNVEEAMIQAGLRRRLTRLQKVELYLQGNLDVELVRNSDVILVSLRIGDPEAGVAILEKLLEAYQESHQKAHQDPGVQEFFAGETADLRERLTKSEAALLEFQQSADVWSVEEQRKVLLDNRKALQLQVSMTRAGVAALDAELNLLKSSLGALPETVELSRTEQLNPAIEALEDRRASLNLDLATVDTSYTADSRESDDRRRRILEIEKLLARQPALVPHSTMTGINPVRQELSKQLALKSAELEGERRQLATEEEQLAEVNQRLQVFGAAALRFQQLERENQLLERNYSLYAENNERSRISAVMNQAQISNMRLISPPHSSLKPVRPRLSLVLAAGFFAGLVFSIALAFGLEVRKAARAPGP